MKGKKLLLPLLALVACLGGMVACDDSDTSSSYPGNQQQSASENECTDHDWGRRYVFIAPTEEENGELIYACDQCNAVKMEQITPDGDEDEDLLTNYEELVLYNTDPFEEDTDGDNLLDEEEVRLFFTNPAKYDSDDDGLSDYDEFTYETDPMKADTDGDGLSDGNEIKYGFDPLTPEDSFSVVVKPEVEVEDTVDPSLEIEVDGAVLDTLKVTPDDFFSEDTLGYVGKAYDYEVEGDIGSAVISFEFDEDNVDKDAELVIYDFNSDKREMRPLPTTVDGNKASAVVTELSTYILLDRRVYEEEFKWVDTWDTEASYSSIEIVFVVDDSGSMTSNDRYNERLSVAQDLISKLPQNSQVGVVKFESSVTTLTSLTTDKDQAMDYLTSSYFKSSGGTKMYTAIKSAFNLFGSKIDTMRVMVVLSDGETEDTSSHSSVVSTATSKGIMVYTIGLGSSSSYFTSYLQPLANNTSGAFYYASQASQLTAIYDNIKEKMDIQSDYDGDGLSDYYEKNMVVFEGIGYELDFENPDTDGDGLKDGVEVKTVTLFNDNGTKMTILGRVFSDPTEVDSDDDGVDDKSDRYPLNPKKS